MRHRCIVWILSAAVFCGCAAGPTLREQSRMYFDNPRVAPITSKGLETFKDQREIAGYLRTVDRLREQQITARLLESKAGMTVQQEEACTLLEECESDELDSVTVTGSRIASPSITNNQTVGVDEGDIVKQIGDYFLILQDGRIFAVHAPSLKLTDRVDIYRPRDPARPKTYRWEDDFDGADWYDEMLIHEQLVIVAAYSYGDHATELSIFELDSTTGRLRLRTRHLLASSDYFSNSNYASRIVGDTLILRTSQPLAEVENWPSWRQQAPVMQDLGTLLPARSVFKPVLPTLQPWLHQITSCRLDRIREDGDLACDAVGFVGPGASEFYVSPDFIYFWNTAGDDSDFECEQIGVRPDEQVPAREVPKAAVYRIALRDQSVTVASARGWMFDQFHLDEYQHRLRAVVDWGHGGCYGWWEQRATRFLTLHGSDFGVRFDTPDSVRFTALPRLSGDDYHARFIDEWLVLGAERDPSDRTSMAEPPVVVLQARAPERARRLDPGHGLSRVEHVGAHALLVGPDNAQGLGVTVLAFGDEARPLATVNLDQRREGESRSHAFNFTIEGEETIMGLPTQRNDRESGKYWDETSDLSYLSLRANRLASLGEIRVSESGQEQQSDYVCEVSCFDWYGNARPIFSTVGWFGLMGTELVRLRREHEQIVAGSRLDLTRPPIREAAAPPR